MILDAKYFIYINIAICAIYLIAVLISLKKGLIYELLSLLFIAVSLVIAIFGSKPLATLYPILNFDFGTIGKVININLYINRAIYILIIYVVFRLVTIFIMPLFKKISNIPVVGPVNRIGGALIGFLKATVIVLILSLALNVPLLENREEVKEGTLFKYICGYTEDLVNIAYENVDIEIDAEQIVETIDNVIDFEKLGIKKEDVDKIIKEYHLENIKINKETIDEALSIIGVNSIDEIDVNKIPSSKLDELLDWAKNKFNE